MVKLDLYLAGQSRNSLVALRNLREMLSRLPEDTVELSVIDVLVSPMRALDEGVLVTPTLIRRDPQPVSIVIGTLADSEAVAALLEVGGQVN